MTTQTANKSGDLLLPVAVLGVLSIMVLPLPAMALDALLALNVSLAVLVLLVSLSLTKPLDFSVFPSLLLITTLFRLGLNVATTRLILLRGSEGPQAAGHLIETFGRFAVGGSLIVGAVVFLILLVVNFAVITKGANRIAEVSARFTLDALPGKQMSIDADLAAGIIDDNGAKARRQNLERETEFFGAMDGASKFVRGDAVAGLAITGINIVGGLLAGLLRDHLSILNAAETYTLLTVGDGLVSQIPALLVSTAAGIVVTRAGSGAALGTQFGQQVLGDPVVLQAAAGVFAAFGLLPGMPTVAFLSLAGGTYMLSRRAKNIRAQSARPKRDEGEADKSKGEKMSDVLVVEPLELQLGFGLLSLIDQNKGGELPARVIALRKQLAQELGVVMPAVHLRDDLRLEANAYRMLLRGQEIARGNAWPDRLMVLDPRGTPPAVKGITAKEPAFGLPAVWIEQKDRAGAEAASLTLVDPASVVTTHLSEVLRRNAHEILGRQETQELLGITAKEAPKLVEESVPGALSLGELVRVLRGLLREGISIRDMRTILEAVADNAPRSKDTGFLVEQARRRLSRQITARLSDNLGVVHAITLDRNVEDTLRGSLAQSDGEILLSPEVNAARAFLGSLEARAAALASSGKPAVVLAPPDLRKPLFDFANRFVPDLWVVSARELLPGTAIEPAGAVQL
ncbi:MAG: flagellar biosynthesis protein FlhA [Deltaproteobacteria bacterium]|nr:flagellar biosynthesis protein FlhA [Deltaproteobacteria bacterium]